MGVLLDLEGTSIKEMQAIFIKKASEITKVTTSAAVTAAGSNGAINIWLDDDMHFRCEAMKFMVTVDKQTYSDVSKVKAWAKKWLSEIKVSA